MDLGLGWAGLGWDRHGVRHGVGLGWAGLGWAGLGWAGLVLGWAGLGWAGGWLGGARPRINWGVLEDLGFRVHDFGFRILGSGQSRVPLGFRI